MSELLKKIILFFAGYHTILGIVGSVCCLYLHVITFLLQNSESTIEEVEILKKVIIKEMTCYSGCIRNLKTGVHILLGI